MMDSYDKSRNHVYHQQSGHPPHTGSHSPLPIRNAIIIPTLKGFECKFPRTKFNGD